jgi:hypothetical protein
LPIRSIPGIGRPSDAGAHNGGHLVVSSVINIAMHCFGMV